MTRRPVLALVLGFPLAALLGFLLDASQMPLGWILGAIAAGAAATNLIGPPVLASPLRRCSQLLIGAAAAAVMTPDVLRTMSALLPAMFGAAILANLFGAALIWPFMKVTGTDRTTAALSVLPAGMAEMSSLAQDLGARSDVVVVVHTLRVVLVVVSIPLLLDLSAGPLDRPEPVPGASLAALLACIAIAAMAAHLSSRIGILNPWILAPMVVGVSLTAFGFPQLPLPPVLLIAAQIGIGFALGTRLRAADLVGLPVIVAAALGSGLLLIFAMLFFVAPPLTRLLGIDPVSLSLAVAPGGLGEMIATSKAIGAATATVAGFQFVRSFLTNVLVPPIVQRLVRA